MYAAERATLVERFGGVTAYMRSPAKGLWRDGGKTKRDDMVILEVMVRRVDRKWWNGHRHKLQKRFKQRDSLSGRRISIFCRLFLSARSVPLSPLLGFVRICSFL